MKNPITKVSLGLSALVASFVLASCGGTNGGPAGSQSFDGSSYSAGSAGSISLQLASDQIAVGAMTGFSVRATGEDGQPVANIEIACDTETGLALIEPSTGYEATDSSGQMSGKVGCLTPGSYLIGCRLPVGANKRQLATVRCTGEIPAGFTEFPGSGGGTLGTGSTDSGGGASSGSARVTKIQAIDNSSTSESTIIEVDVVRDVCSDNKAEPFYNSYLDITVNNTMASTINFYKYSYRISGSEGFESDEIPFINSGDVAPNDSTTLRGLFLNASGGRKYVVGMDSTPIPANAGGRELTVFLTGTDGTGEDVQIEGTAEIIMADMDMCPVS